MICTYRFICAWMKYRESETGSEMDEVKLYHSILRLRTDKMINHYVNHVVVGFTHKIWDTHIRSRSNQGWFRAWKICFNAETQREGEREKNSPHTHVHDYKPVNWMNNNQCECHVQQSVSLFQNGRNVELFVEGVCNKFKSVRLPSKRMARQCTTQHTMKYNWVQCNNMTFCQWIVSRSTPNWNHFYEIHRWNHPVWLALAQNGHFSKKISTNPCVYARRRAIISLIFNCIHFIWRWMQRTYAHWHLSNNCSTTLDLTFRLTLL